MKHGTIITHINHIYYFCSLSFTASQDLHPCLCDSNSGSWQTELGNIIEEAYFPLIRLYSGETGGGSEQVKYTMGPLKCQGGQNLTFA